ncbi:MAG: hypothetical protein QXH07_06115 [Thermoplasmata archaeon]
MVKKNQDLDKVKLFKEITKDASLFGAGLLIGPVVDAGQLAHKYYHIWKNKRVR